MAGELSSDEVSELDGYLGRLAPESAPAADDRQARRQRLYWTFAEGLVESLDQLPFDLQRRLVQVAVRFPDDTFFKLLSALSEEASGVDAERGVELALLALDSLKANGMLETHPEQAALDRERLARARQRAGAGQQAP